MVNAKLPITDARTKLDSLRHPSRNIKPDIRMGMVKINPSLPIRRRVTINTPDEAPTLIASFAVIFTPAFLPEESCFLTLKKPDIAVNTIPIVSTIWGHHAEPRGSMVVAGSERDVTYKNSIPKKITA